MMQEITLKPGMERMIQKKVAYEDTTVSFGRAGIETLFSTPALVTMMIEACVDLVGDNVPDGTVTVARGLQVTHEKPTLQGMTVTVKAMVDRLEGNVIYFDLVCMDEVGQIAKGRMERHIVSKDALIKRAHNRAEILEDINR
ncbi:thioesterase family protein [Anoxynatronum sibiricum]|uniref:Hotdog domain-containing protein n=1 Tax=Anoxynatronum sibiricum TaxID=210623 RepID=A0ABU9VRV8_9CLOT